MPVFAVCCEDRAKYVIVAACEMNYEGEYVARELIQEQTLENLEAFSTRLDQTHDRIGTCENC